MKEIPYATQPQTGNLPAFKTSLTKPEVAAYFQKTQRTIDTWMANGLLPYYKIGRSVIFRLEDIQTHLDQTCRVVKGGAK